MLSLTKQFVLPYPSPNTQMASGCTSMYCTVVPGLVCYVSHVGLVPQRPPPLIAREQSPPNHWLVFYQPARRPIVLASGFGDGVTQPSVPHTSLCVPIGCKIFPASSTATTSRNVFGWLNTRAQIKIVANPCRAQRSSFFGPSSSSPLPLRSTSLSFLIWTSHTSTLESGV